MKFVKFLKPIFTLRDVFFFYLFILFNCTYLAICFVNVNGSRAWESKFCYFFLMFNINFYNYLFTQFTIHEFSYSNQIITCYDFKKYRNHIYVCVMLDYLLLLGCNRSLLAPSPYVGSSHFIEFCTHWLDLEFRGVDAPSGCLVALCLLYYTWGVALLASSSMGSTDTCWFSPVLRRVAVHLCEVFTVCEYYLNSLNG